MAARRKKRITKSEYDRRLLKLIDKWREETGRTDWDLNAVVDWAEANGHWTPPRHDAKRRFARELAQAARHDFIEDENGQPVRRRHAYRVPGTQLTLWRMIDDLTPEQMRTSAQLRRRQIEGEVLQCDRDLRYYNDHVNPGDPIQLSWNFDEDVRESQMPTEYPDEPPPEEES